MKHELKTWPVPFQAILDGIKPYEIRAADRRFVVGDVLHLREYDNGSTGSIEGHYTGRSVDLRISYMTPPGEWGLPTNLCVLGLAAMPDHGKVRVEPDSVAAIVDDFKCDMSDAEIQSLRARLDAEHAARLAEIHAHKETIGELAEALGLLRHLQYRPRRAGLAPECVECGAMGAISESLRKMAPAPCAPSCRLSALLAANVKEDGDEH